MGFDTLRIHSITFRTIPVLVALSVVTPAARAKTPLATPLATPPAPRATASTGAPRSKPEQITVHRIFDGARDHQPGGGLIQPENGTRSVSIVSRDYMDHQAPTSTAYQLVSVLPGANVATSDPFGFSPATNISVRGLNNDALGYTLEGMPLNDVAYYTGYPSQFADNENYRQVALEQGSADLDSPVLNAAGGLMTLQFLDPGTRPGGYASLSYGSYNTDREFLRLETGQIGRSGIRAFISYSHGATDNWRGPGRDQRHHVDFKALKEWGAGNRAAVLGSFNSTITSSYPQVTLAQWHQDGIHGANNRAARFDPSDAQGGTDYYRFWRAPERTLYVGAPVHLALTDHLTLDTTPYTQYAYGNVPSGSTLAETGLYNGTQPFAGTVSLPGAQNGTAIVRANYTQRSYRSGFNSRLHIHAGVHDIVLGYWYDYSDDNEQQPFTAVGPDGTSADIWAENASTLLHTSLGQRILAGSNHTISQTNALFLGDHLSLLDNRLAIDLGVKEVMLSRDGVNAVPGPQYHVTSNIAEPLPRFGLRWRFTQTDQIFLNATTNFRAPDGTAYYNTYDPNSGNLEATGTGNTRPEYSISEELGYRRTGQWLIGSVTLFNYNFTNRQVSTVIPENGALISTTLNAGGQTSRGVDVELGTRPWRSFSLYASGEYLHATIDNDIVSGGDLLPTRSKIAVRSPALQASAVLTYDDGHVFGTATLHYTGHQFATFMNDERLSDHTTGDLSIGYRFSDISRLHRPNLRLNLINITNARYLSGVANPTFNTQTTTGRLGSAISGSAPIYYIGGGFAALVTAATGF